jgi:hypothetical protein
MRVKFTLGVENFEDVTVDLDAVPREGETVMLPGLDAGVSVLTVTWYPRGARDSEDNAGVVREPGPFVYVLLQPQRGVL